MDSLVSFRKNELMFILIESLILMMFIYAGVYLVDVNFTAKTFALTINENPLALPVLFLAIISTILFYIFLWKKHPMFLEKDKQAQDLIKSTIKEKIINAKQDSRISVLFFIEFIFIIFIVVAIAAYLDPGVQLVNWVERGISEEAGSLINIVVFIVMVSLLLFVYNFTKTYRLAFSKKPLAKKMVERIKQKNN